MTHQPVAVWVYEGTLKIEYQATTLSKYSVELQEDRRHVREVSNPHLANALFRSPQLTLIDLSPNEWLHYWRVSAYAPACRKQQVSGIVQLPLFDIPVQQKTAGANGEDHITQPHPFPHIVPKSSYEQEP